VQITLQIIKLCANKISSPPACVLGSAAIYSVVTIGMKIWSYASGESSEKSHVERLGLSKKEKETYAKSFKYSRDQSYWSIPVAILQMIQYKTRLHPK
jgi:hypothetical protein